jgi:catalase
VNRRVSLTRTLRLFNETRTRLASDLAVMVATTEKSTPELARPASANDSKAWTTNQGAPVQSNMHSETVGARGPVLLEDYHLIERLAAFHRERIPERVVHARGMAAKGHFEVTHDVTNLTYADFLSEVGKKTDLTVRFSTVVHERGSPESMRDVRGFSVKMYTNEGIWDHVGNDIPVFFIRDGIKFVDLVHSLKPSPKKHVQEGWRVLDFLSHHPESCHILTYLLGDEGIPADYRHMNGFGVHTFKLVTQEGKETYIKWHWISKQGEKYMTNEEADAKGSGPKKPVTATLDLYEAIEAGDYPQWELLIQTMDPAIEDTLDFDPLDSTSLWPEDQFPLRPVGLMTLNKNVDNWFTDNEMVAFNPGVMPPGLLPSDDKLLQSRIFSYSDAQRYRLGANYLTLPINAPRNKHHNNHYDGAMNMVKRTEDIDYFPSRHTSTVDGAVRGPTMQQEKVKGPSKKMEIAKTNNFAQAGVRIRGFKPDQRERFIENIEMWMTEPKTTDEVRSIWYDYWSQCDVDFGAELKSKVEASLKEA